MAKKEDDKKLEIKLYNENRAKPSAIDLEEAILGAIMVEHGVINLIRPIIDRGIIFYKEANRIIYDTMLEMSNDPSKVIDMLTVSEELKIGKKFEAIGGYQYLVKLTKDIGGGAHIINHAKYVVDKFLLREMIRLTSEAQKMSYNQDDIEDITNYVLEEIDRILAITKSKNTSNFKDAMRSALNDINERVSKGAAGSIILTGDAIFDKRISLDLNNVVVFSGRNSSGKSQYVIHLARGILDHNSDIEILWFSMEDPKEKIVRRMVAMDVKLDDKQMTGKKGLLTEEDTIAIANAMKKIVNYKVQFYDKKIDITMLKRYAITFAKKSIENNKRPIVIIDNLGLINCNIRNSVERDDHIANELVEIKSETGALVMLVHHLSKEIDSGDNLKGGYRPIEKNIRGSARIIDYADISLLINRPSKYPDLMNAYKKTNAVYPTELLQGELNGVEFDKHFLCLNPVKEDNRIDIEAFKKKTWEEFKKVVGNKVKIKYLYDQYIAYLNFQDTVNADRDAKYYKAPYSLYKFLKDEMYKQKWTTDKESRNYYLFGDKRPSYDVLSTLFIAEASKVRDDELTPEQAILRYNANLNWCIYKELH